ncbi:MAG: hypothetical protein IKB97_06300, partial [Bacteroidaceae bacterium]|nr:hypothetical protein [Bacteroidaceae bacterium]
MKKKNPLYHFIKWLSVAIATPVVLFLLLALIVYLPPVQKFAVRKATEMLSKETGFNISIGHVRLAFPLDLTLHKLLATDGADTLVQAQAVYLDVRLLPLFQGRADIDGLALYDARLDTKSLIADTRIKGSVGELSAASHGVEWGKELVKLDQVTLRYGNLWVALSDTAQQDTATTASQWKILLDKAEIASTSLRLTMPGDTLRLAAHIGDAQLCDGLFDTGKAYYAFRRLTLQEGFAQMRSGATEVSFFAWLPQMPPTLPCTGAFSPNDIAVSRLHLAVDSLSFDSTATLRTDIRHVSFYEQSGFEVKNLSGKVYMDSVRLQVPALHFTTPHSRLDAGIDVDWRALKAGNKGQCRVLLDANLGHRDVHTLMAEFLDAEALKAYPNKPLVLKATAMGNTDLLVVEDLTCSLPGVVQLKGAATARHLMEPSRSGDARFDLRTGDLNCLMGLLPPDVRTSIGFANPMTATGKASFSGDNYNTDLRMTAEQGVLTAQARLNLQQESYHVAADGKAVPLGTFLPGSGLGNFSGHLKATGKGLDVLSPKAEMQAEAAIDSFYYDGWHLDRIDFSARLADSKAVANFSSDNDLLLGQGELTADLGEMMHFGLNADLPLINITALSGIKDTLQMGTAINITAHADRELTDYGAEGSIGNVRFLTPEKSIPSTDVDFSFNTDSTATKAYLASGDLSLRMEAESCVDSLVAQFLHFADSLNYQLENKSLNQTTLKSTLPVMSFFINAGRHNPLSNILRYKDYTYNGIYVNLNTHPEKGLNGLAQVGNLKSGSLLLDTVHIDIHQEKEGVVMNGTIHNY